MIPLWVWQSGFVVFGLIAAVAIFAFVNEALQRRRVEQQYMECMGKRFRDRARQGAFLCVFLLAVAGCAWAQTKLGPDQWAKLSPTQASGKVPVVIEWGICRDPIPPDPKSSCVGLELMRFRYEDGSEKLFTLSPAGSITMDSFVRVPLN